MYVNCSLDRNGWRKQCLPDESNLEKVVQYSHVKVVTNSVKTLSNRVSLFLSQ